MIPVDDYGLSYAWSSTAQFLVFSPLVARNERGDLEPRLAASWEHSPDYRQWTVRLRSDVRWHDGAPFTAHDVKFTLDLLTYDYLGGRSRGYAVEVLDDSTYHITYERPGIGSPLDDYTVIYPQHLLSGLDPAAHAEWDFWKTPVGTGAFRHVRTVEGTGMELEANPEYFRGKPRIERVVLKFGAPQLQMLLGGEIDVLPNVSELDRLKLEGDRFAVYRWWNPSRMKVVFWNHRSPCFADAMVRRAVAHAVDREELHRVLGLPDEVRAFDGLYSERQLRRRELPPALPYDVERASRLLDEAGWRDHDGDGLRDRDGLPLRFTLLFRDEDGGGWAAQGSEGIALFIQDQLSRIGIAVDLRPWELSIREPFAESTADAAIGDVASLGTRVRFFGEHSWIGYENPEVHELLTRIAEAFDPDSVDHLYAELSRIFAEQQPALFLYPAVSTTIVNRRLRGMSAPHRALAIWYLEDLWIEPRP